MEPHGWGLSVSNSGEVHLSAIIALLAQLAALSDAVTRLRKTQDRAAQAAAARGAAEQLGLTAGQRTSPRGGPLAAAATQARRTGMSFDVGRPRPDSRTSRTAPRTEPVGDWRS